MKKIIKKQKRLWLEQSFSTTIKMTSFGGWGVGNRLGAVTS